jgi:hypothetical protein
MLEVIPQFLQKSRLEPVIKELLALGLSPIPVVPVQHNQGFKVINGKSPSYFENSKPKLLAHKQGGLHDRLPSQAELETWFSDSRVGIGSFGSSDGLTCWIDFDAKHFESKKACRRAVAQWREQNGIKDSWTDESGSGGYRVLVRFEEKPRFSKFALTPGGKPVGEILGKNNFCVLAPSLHPTGRRYKRVKNGGAGKLQSPESAGLYPIATITPAQLLIGYKPNYKAAETNREWNESDWARSYLKALQPWRAEDYDCWLRIGIALRSVNDPTLLDDWVEFSKQSAKFKAGECERKWGSFKVGRLGLGTLHYYASQDGWENPFATHCDEAWLESLNLGKPTDFNLKRWLNSRKYTPDITIDQQFFDFGDIPESGVIVGGKSGLGSGKTAAILRVIKSSNRGSRLIGYRNNLLIQTTERAFKDWGISYHHLHKDDSFALLADRHSHVAFCLDSITHSSPSYFEQTDIILDETCSVLLHGAEGGTLGDQQSICLELLKQALENCERVFCLDGNLRDIDIELIGKLSGNKKVIKIKNTWKGNPHNITFVEGMDVEDEIKKRDRSALLKLVLAPDVVPWIATDSKDRSKIFCNLLSEQGKTGYVLNSETSSEDWAKEFLADPTAFIQLHKPDFVIISPSGDSGLDVHGNGHFTHKFTFLSGVLGTNSQTQLMFRLRDNLPHYVICPEKGQVKDRNSPKTYSEKKFKEQAEEFILQSALLASQGTEQPADVLSILKETLERSNNDYWQYSCLLGALDKYEMDNLRKCLVYALEEAGHRVEIVQWRANEAIKQREKQVKEEILLEHATEIFKAPDISFEQARALAKKSSGSKDEQRQVEKAFLVNRLPGIKESEHWTPEFILDKYIKQQDFITKQERFWLLQNFHISAKRHEVDWFFHYQREFFYLGSARKSNHSIIWALQQLGISRFYEGEWHKDSPEVLEVFEKGKKPDIVLALGIAPGTETANGKERIEYIKQVLDLVDAKFGKGQKRTIGNQRVRVYSVDREAWNDPVRLIAIESVGQKFTDWFESDKSKVTWFEPTPQNSPEIASNPEIEQVSESVRTPLITYKHGGVWTPSETEVQPNPVDLVEELAIAFEYCDAPDVFAAAIEGYPINVVKDAIAIQDSQPMRSQLSQWLAALSSQLNAATVESSLEQLPDQGRELPFYLDTDLSSPPIVEDLSQGLGESCDPESVIAELAIAFEYCDVPDLFAAAIEGHPINVVKDAIALQPDQPRRRQLTEWLTPGVGQNQTDPLTQRWQGRERTSQVVRREKSTEGFFAGQRLRRVRGIAEGKIAQVLESFGDWCESSLGAITWSEVESGSWELCSG